LRPRDFAGCYAIAFRLPSDVLGFSGFFKLFPDIADHMTKFTQMAANEDEGGASRRRIHLREISGDGDAPLETVGQDLRAARVRRGDDLAAVSRALKIRKDHIDALESDRIDDLPGKTYAIGFVRSYARYLGLDVAMVLDRFKAEISGRSDEIPLAIASIHQDESRRLPQGWRIVAAVVIIALVWGTWHIFFAIRDPGQSVPPPPKLTQSEPPKLAQAEAPKPSAPVPMPAPTPSSPAPEASNAPPLPAAIKTDPKAQIAPAQTPPQQASASPQQAGASPGEVFGQQNANVRVVLHADNPTRLTVRGMDGKVYINKDLQPGQAYRVPDIEGLTLATDNAGAVDVDLDGVAMGRIGQPQQILGRVSLDPQSLASRLGRH
jgi:cytoskeleton protein RodZ